MQKPRDRDIISLLDLTSLNESDNETSIKQLCRQALTPVGAVAAVCVYPEFVELAKTQLMTTPVSVATVANFPTGQAVLTDVVKAIQTAIDSGADEVDVVMPYQHYQNGYKADVAEFLQSCRGICRPPIVMKVIIETGALVNHDVIAGASELAIDCGADFIKTSTGKRYPGASLEAAEVILNAIQQSATPNTVGIKLSGGVKTREQAQQYWALVARMMGQAWINSHTLRFGASSLLATLLE